MLKALALGAFLGLAAVACNKSEAASGAEQKALPAAESWLALVDQEKYADSWQQAAKYFKDSVASEQWQKQVAAVRQPLGKLVSRTVKTKTYATSLPGAPDGKYVVIQYDAVYEKKASAIETVTPTEDADGTWRVSGYYIR